MCRGRKPVVQRDNFRARNGRWFVLYVLSFMRIEQSVRSFFFAKRQRPCALIAARTDGVQQSRIGRTNKTARGGCSLCRSRATKNKTVKGMAYQSSERPVRRSFFDFAMLPVAASKTARGGCSLCRSRATKNKTVKGMAYQSSERPVRRSFFDFAMLPVAASRRKRKAGNRFCWHACFDTSLRQRPGAVRHIPAAQAAKEPPRYWP